jgi:hypothetical protein
MRVPRLDGPGLMEWLVIGALVLIFVGPERLPDGARWLVRLWARLRAVLGLRPREAARPPDGWDVVELVSLALIALLLPTWIVLLTTR